MNVIIPTAFRKHTDGKQSVSVSAATVDGALAQLVKTYPDLRSRLLDDSDNVLSFVNVFVNDRNIRDLDNEATKLAETDQILLVPAIAGG